MESLKRLLSFKPLTVAFGQGDDDTMEREKAKHAVKKVRVDEIDYRATSAVKPSLTVPRASAAECRHHSLIVGPGRAGTTFLVQLLTRLGLDTGFNKDSMMVYQAARAGMERHLHEPDAPYIVKDPLIGRDLHDHLVSGLIVIDHVFIPLRDATASALSRASVQLSITGRLQREKYVIPGGLWKANTIEEQQAISAQMIYDLVGVLARYDIPTTFLWYPRLAQDDKYLHRKLSPVLEGIPLDTFRRAFMETVRPGWISTYTENDF